MPPLPAALTSPGLLLALCVMGGLVIGVNATLVTMLRRGSHSKATSNPWGQALGGARERQRQQTAQMEELHRAVTNLSAPISEPVKPNE